MSVQDTLFAIERYIEQNFPTWVEQTVIDECKAFARAAGHSDNFLASIKFVKLGPYNGYVILDLPYGIFVEKDTKEHDIKGKDHPLGPMEGVGESKFYWKVHHPGTTGQHIMERGERFGMPRLADKIITETNKFMRGGINGSST